MKIKFTYISLCVCIPAGHVLQTPPTSDGGGTVISETGNTSAVVCFKTNIALKHWLDDNNA